MSHCALRRAWEGDPPASLNVFVSPETGLVTLFANIAAGDWCIAVGYGARAKASAIRAPPRLPFHTLRSFVRLTSAFAAGGAWEAAWQKRIGFL